MDKGVALPTTTDMVMRDKTFHDNNLLVNVVVPLVECLEIPILPLNWPRLISGLRLGQRLEEEKVLLKIPMPID